MSENTRYRIQSVSYDTIAIAFSEEAESLIAASSIRETLDTEKIRFENASLLHISTEKLVGHNTARYCKDLLRKKQPLPFVYLLLCFFSEISGCLIPYGILVEVIQYISLKNGSSFPFPTLYGLYAIVGFVAANTLYRQYMLNLLSKPFVLQEAQKKRQTDSENRSVSAAAKSLTRFRFLTYLGAAVFIPAAILLTAVLKWEQKVFLRLSTCFIAYVACILLSGVHNVLYSSHFLSFFTIGILILGRHPKTEIEAAAKQYFNLCYLQMLAPAHKTLKDLKNNAELEKKLRESLHSRMITQRIYELFALIICLALDVVCIGRLRLGATIALICFFVLAALLTCIMLLAFISANHILKHTK